MYAARYPKSEKMREKIGTQMQESARIEAADWLRTGAARGATVHRLPIAEHEQRPYWISPLRSCYTPRLG